MLLNSRAQATISFASSWNILRSGRIIQFDTSNQTKLSPTLPEGLTRDRASEVFQGIDSPPGSQVEPKPRRSQGLGIFRTGIGPNDREIV